MNIKTIDINAKEWFDKVNGNSYFSAEVILDYGTREERILKLPFQYGYGEQYTHEGFKVIKQFLSIEYKRTLWQYCKDKDIILRTSKQDNCLKREVKD